MIPAIASAAQLPDVISTGVRMLRDGVEKSLLSAQGGSALWKIDEPKNHSGDEYLASAALLRMN